MEEENIFLQMVLYMKDIGEWIKLVEEED